MRHSVVILIWLLFSLQCALANVVTGVAAVPTGYYNGVSGKKGADNILGALNTCISRGYNEISYKGLEPHYLNTDFYSDTLWDMYSTCRFDYEDANNPQSKVCDGWNKEHVCCQSWLGSGPMVSDMFNVYPTDARVNNLRSNYPYGVVATVKTITGDPYNHALGKLGTSALSGCTTTVYEPDDRYKGDFARTFFYMVARYRSNILNSGNGSTMFTSNPTNLTAYSLAFLLQWHRNDPVSEKEIDRNQAVYGEQNNRNPFIDYPDLVEYIWGNKVGQTVDLSTMTPTCDGMTAAPKYGVQWMADGVVIRTDSVRENNKPASLPASPALLLCANAFVGWTDAPLSAMQTYAPDVLYTKEADFPATITDVTYHAVFAEAQMIDNGTVETNETIAFAELCSPNETPASITHGAVTLTFSRGTNTGSAPKYFTNGNALRCYGGNTITVTATAMTAIDFTFGASDGSNTISASTGTYAGTRWTGNANQVKFTIGGSSGNRRLTQMVVTLNGSGQQTVYTGYMTSCGQASAVNLTASPDEQKARKLLRNGQIYILIGEQMYNLTGQKVH